MATQKSSEPKGKFSVKKTKDGLMNTLYLIAGLFIGGLLEEYAFSKVAYLADTKVDATDATKTTKNTVGIMLKSAAYIVGGLGAGQLINHKAAEWAGYGLASYGGLKAAKTISETAKPYGLNGSPSDPQFPVYQLQQEYSPRSESM